MYNHIKILRPVGNTINTTESKVVDTPFPPFHSSFYSSGTAALAATIIAARNRRPDIDKPEVLVPAYGCPDLISAIIYADAIPVLVDLEPDSPRMSLKQLGNLITDKTTAIIAVRFFGISERNESLSILAKQHDLTLIEDSAQGFPTTDLDSYWHGDFTILSFGRGKPVNLLGGGAVLTKNPEQIKLLPEPSPFQKSYLNMVKYKIKLFLYNQSIHPLAYGLINQIPGLHIGETIYKPLHAINSMADFTKSLLYSNLSSYRARNSCQKRYNEFFQEFDSEKIIDLPSTLTHDMSQPLLRYPILIKDVSLREQIYQELKFCGASLMYKLPLHEINNVNRLIKPANYKYPNATEFSHQLLTLPTHEAVDDSTLQTIRSTVNKI